MSAVERTDVLVIGTGFGGAIAAYHLSAGGAKVVMLERGPRLESQEVEHDYKLGASYTRIFDFVVGDGISVLGGNCVGGGSVVYFGALPGAPRSMSGRRGGSGRRMWPRPLPGAALEAWYDRVAEARPVSTQDWNDVSYPGGLRAAASDHAGLAATPVPVAVDNSRCTN